jgi:cell filamentation protein
VNKLGIREQNALTEAEKITVSLHSIEIEQTSFEEPFTFAFYCQLHKTLFQDLYDWAGCLRTVDLAKKGTRFYPADSLLELGEAKFQWLQNANEFRGLSRVEFVNEIAEFYHEINMLHPFREGNGRTQRLFFTLLIRRAGYQINFSTCDTDLLMFATIQAAQGVMTNLQAFFSGAIHCVSKLDAK